MATLETISMYAMYVIGEVESTWRWNAVNYNDPITIGMMQYYGANAAHLIEVCAEADPEGYAAFKAAAPRVAAAVEAGHDWNWWTNFYLTKAEGTAWEIWAERDANHAAQQADWLDRFSGYVDTLESWGLSMSYPHTLIYAASMYHQRPASAADVIKACSATAVLSNMHATCLNNSILGQYYNRYNTVFLRLRSWDGESDPPDFGQVTDYYMPGGNAGTPARPDAPVSRVEMRNGALVVWGMESYPNGLYCMPAGPLTWIPVSGYVGAPTDNEQYNWGDLEGDEARAAIVQLYKSWENRFDYSQAAGRLDPETNGYGDCSSTIWRAYSNVAGIDVGTWTGQMCEKGTLIASGGTNDRIPIERMLPADLILIDWPENGYTSTFDHVELYTGNNEMWGHGGGAYGTEDGPNLTTSNVANYSQYMLRWQVRRYL